MMKKIALIISLVTIVFVLCTLAFALPSAAQPTPTPTPTESPTPTVTASPTPTESPTPTPEPGQCWEIPYHTVGGEFVLVYSMYDVTYSTVNTSCPHTHVTINFSTFNVSSGYVDVAIDSEDFISQTFNIPIAMTITDVTLFLNDDAHGRLYLGNDTGDVDALSETTVSQTDFTIGDGTMDSAGCLLLEVPLVAELEMLGIETNEPMGTFMTTNHSYNHITEPGAAINDSVLEEYGVSFGVNGGPAPYIGTSGTLIGTGAILEQGFIGFDFDFQFKLVMVLEPTSEPAPTPTPDTYMDPVPGFVNSDFIDSAFAGHPWITGTSLDSSPPHLITDVEIQIKRNSDSYCWNDSAAPAAWVNNLSWNSVTAYGTLVQESWTSDQWAWSYTGAVDSSDFDAGASYTVKARARDNYGSRDPTPATYTFVYDDACPDTSFSTVFPSTIYSLTEIKGNAIDDDGVIDHTRLEIQNVDNSLYWNGHFWQANGVWIKTQGTSSWSINTTTNPPLPQWQNDTNYRVRASTVDKANNLNTEAWKTFLYRKQLTSASCYLDLLPDYANAATSFIVNGFTGTSMATGGHIITDVRVQIIDSSNGSVWWDDTGGIWNTTFSTPTDWPYCPQATITAMPAYGQYDWSCPMPGGITWVEGHTYRIRAQATDNATPTLHTYLSGIEIFSFDGSKPASNIDVFDAVVYNTLNSINGNSADATNGEIGGVVMLLNRSGDGRYWNGAGWGNAEWGNATLDWWDWIFATASDGNFNDDSEGWKVTNTTNPKLPPLKNDEGYHIEVHAFDKAGNVETTAIKDFSFRIDLTSYTPPTPTQTPTSGPTYVPPGATPSPTITSSPTPTSSPTRTPTPTPTSSPTPTPSATPTASTTPPGGSTLNVNVCGQVTSCSIYTDGSIPADTEASSGDGSVTVGLPAGTQIGSSDGGTSDSLEVMPVYPLPEPPQGCMILAAFSFQPDNNTFNPPIQITLKYDPNLIPWGMNESNLAVAVLNETSGQWDFFNGTVNAAANTFSFTISHCSVYGLLATPATPAHPASSGPNEDILIGIIGGIVVLLVILLISLLIGNRSHKAKPSPE